MTFCSAFDLNTIPTLVTVAVTTLRIATRPRAYVRVAGPDAEDYLQRMLSNDVAAVPVGGVCEALLLTPKARLIAPMRVARREQDDFLLLTEPELGDAVARELTRMRFAAKCEIEQIEHESFVVLGATEGGMPTDEYGVPAVEVLGSPPDGELVGEDELERLRIEAGTPRWGRELDDSILPAEAGLERTHISFTKGCYPGQEPIARLHYRGHVNRSLRVLEVERAAPGDEIEHEGKRVGRVTSAIPGFALGYVRTEVPEDAELRIGAETARLHLLAERP
jgi:folate-binding protein YgfZ